MTPKRRRPHLVWIGPLLAFAGVVSYFQVFAGVPALRDFPWVNLPLILLGLGLSVLAAWRAWRPPGALGARVLAALGLALSLLLAAAFVWYVFSFTYQLPPAGQALGLVDAPDFVLASSSGETVRLSDFRGCKVVLVFYRGFW